MRRVLLIVIALAVLFPALATAQKKKKGGKSSCKFVGVKVDGAVSGALLTAQERSCFSTQAKGESKGFSLIEDLPAGTPTPTPTPGDDSGVRVLSFLLQGGQEVPEEDTVNTGECRALLPSTEDGVKIICTHTIATPTAAHLHTGAAGVDGSVICASTPSDGSSPFTMDCDLDSDQFADLLAGNLYVNVHSDANPDGELRGQVAPYVKALNMDGDQEVPQVVTDATGHCVANLDVSLTTLFVSCTHDVQNANGAHIHIGPRGEDGAITCAFPDAESPIETECPMDEEDLATLYSGNFYVNIHSQVNSGGEIRGQIE